MDAYRTFCVAPAYVALNDSDSAFVWLDNAAEANSFHMATIDAEPMLDAIRHDARFEALRERAGLAHHSSEDPANRATARGFPVWLPRQSGPATAPNQKGLGWQWPACLS